MPSTAYGVTQARHAVGQTALERAKWLLRVAQIDYYKLKKEERVELSLELAVFLESFTKTAQELHSTLPLPHEVEVRNWHRKWKRLLESLKNGKDCAVKAETFLGLRFVGSELRPGLTLPPPTSNDTSDTFVARAVEALARVRDQVRQCAREDCRQLFIKNQKNTRQVYCSAKCRGTVNKRKYRKHTLDTSPTPET